MSLLNTTPPSLSVSERTALRLERIVKQQFDMLLSSWTSAMRTIWTAQDPQAVLDALGPKAIELFQFSAQTAQFLEQLQPGCTTEIAALRPDYTIVDGRIVLSAPGGQ